jgi:hypothetical protein
MNEIIVHLRSIRNMCNDNPYVYNGISVAIKMLRNEQKFNDLLKNKDDEEII